MEAITIESLQRHTDKDKVLSILRDYVTEGKPPDINKLPELKSFAKFFNELTVTEGGLILRGEYCYQWHCSKQQLRKHIKGDIQESQVLKEGCEHTFGAQASIRP